MISKKRRKIVALVTALMMLALVITGCGGSKPAATDKSGEAQSEEVVKLGFLGALTGSVANYGIPAKKGMEMAIDELNAQGGILGKQVVGVYEDNEGDNTKTANITQKYISRDKVNALVGDPCTGVTKVAAEICQKNNMVIFSPGATGTGVVEYGDCVFRNTLLDQFAVPVVVDWMINTKGWKNMAVVTSLNIGYSTALTPVFKEAIEAKGGKIVIEETVNDGDTDFSAQVTKIKRAQPDVLVYTGYYTEAALIQTEAQKQGLDVVLIGGDGLYGKDMIKLGGKAVEEKVIYYCGFSADQPSPATAKFLQDYEARFKEKPDMFSAQYYDAVMILAKAMTDANSTDPAVFKHELAKTKDYPGVSGNTTFRADREPIKSPICLITIKNGEFVLLDTIPVNVN